MYGASILLTVFIYSQFCAAVGPQWITKEFWECGNRLPRTTDIIIIIIMARILLTVGEVGIC
jgi:hypothetical protein